MKSMKVTDAGLVPDSKYQFLLNPKHHYFRNEDTKFVTTSSGLLTSAKVTTSGEAKNIILDLVGSAAGVGFTTLDDDCLEINDHEYYDLSIPSQRTCPSSYKMRQI